MATMPKQEPKMCEVILDRVLARLSHINPAVILSASKVLLRFAKELGNDKITEGICKKVSAPLISILNGPPEMSWIFLRNLQLTLHQFPALFTNVKSFFVNYNDPCYVKSEKVILMLKICDEASTKFIINEFVEYSYDPNAEFARLSFQALWKLALKHESALQPVLIALYTVLLNANESGSTDHLINEAVIGIEQIYRQYLCDETL